MKYVIQDRVYGDFITFVPFATEVTFMKGTLGYTLDIRNAARCSSREDAEEVIKTFKLDEEHEVIEYDEV